jgi:Uma2 family endonuclease
MAGAKTIAQATLADLLAIPEAIRRHEIIDGNLVEKQAASGPHGEAQFKLCEQLRPYNRRPGGRLPGGWRFVTEVEILFTETQILRPDVAGWRRERLPVMPREVPIRVRPDWVYEILSTNKHNDLVKKKRAYHRAEVGHYWLLDPDEQTLVVHRWHADGYVDVLNAERDERVRAEPFDGIELRVATLFDDDNDE